MAEMSLAKALTPLASILPCTRPKMRSIILVFGLGFLLSGTGDLMARTIRKTGLPATRRAAALPNGFDDILPQLEHGVEVGLDINKKLDEILGPAQTAFDTVMDYYTKLADAVVGNQHPTKPDNPYSIDGFAYAVNDAASKLAAANFNPQVLNPSQYSVSVDQFSNCRTQKDAFDRLNGYAAAMEKAAAEGQGTIQALNARLNAVTQFEGLARQFSEVALRAAETPSLEWGVYFASTFWDLDQHLVPAFANLRSVLKQQIDTVTKNVSALQKQSGNLRANLTLFTPGSCQLAGSWSGTCVTQGTGVQTQSTLRLTGSPAQPGTVVVTRTGSQTFNLSQAQISSYFNLVAVMTATNGRLVYQYNLSATFDQSYTSANVTLTSPSPRNNPIACQLSGSASAFTLMENLTQQLLAPKLKSSKPDAFGNR